MDTSEISIESQRLYLKAITIDYKEDIFREFSDKITTYMIPRAAKNIEETIEFIESSIKGNKNGSNFQILIFDKKNKEFLGCGGIHHIDQKTPELGIWLKKSAQGKAYGKETIIALKEWADHNLKYEYLLYPVDARNKTSKRIPEFFGAKVFRKYDEINMSGKKLHILEYRITK